MEDIRKTGPVGLKGINIQNEDIVEPIDLGSTFNWSIPSLPDSYNIGKDIPIYSSTGDLGTSRFDKLGGLTAESVEDVENMRAENQSWGSKLFNGVAKGAVLAGTTFLDGTVGLIYGLGDALLNISNKEESGWETFSRLWDNEFSNGLQQINQMSEDWLPNYRTIEERNNAWYQNLGSVNFWADTFLKNLGFTVGAAYSGRGFTSLLGKVGLIKSGLGAATAGSIYGAINEARVEANNNSDDFFKLEESKMQDSYKAEYDEIWNNGLLDLEQKNQLINQLNVKYEGLKDDLNVRKSKMGLGTFIGNSVFLSLNDFYTLGRFYAKGFQNAKRTSKSLKATADDLYAADQSIGSRISKNKDGLWTAKEVTRKEAFGIGAKKALLEGNEELFQKFISGTSGEMYNTDSPDAYYNASLDEDAKVETEDFIGAALKGFKDSYGNVDSYEEFAVGFLTGALGIPSFGRVQNSDASTYLGRSKSVGLTGGIFGELSMASQANKDMKEAVDYMNQYEQKLKTNKDHFVRSQYFTDAMNGWSETNNAFEYKNMEDNDDFVAISRYAAMGKLDHLKALVNQDFENISDETLQAMARETSTDTSGWYNVDGSYTPDGETGANEMRKELIKKRDQILSNISSYENAIRETQSIANTSLSNDQLNELAWLKWKGDRFVERYSQLRQEFPNFYQALNENINTWEEAISELEKDSSYDKESLKDTKRVVANLKAFVELINKGSNLYEISNFLDENKEFIKDISSEEFYEAFGKHKTLDYGDYQKVLTIMQDVAKIANAYKSFDTRYKEFIEDPLKFQNKRNEASNKKLTQQKTSDKNKSISEIEKLSNNELLQRIDSGEVSLEDLQDVVGFDDIDLENELETEVQKKVQQVTQILEAEEDARSELMRRFQSGEINEKQLEDAMSMLENSLASTENIDDFLNMDLESALDSSVLPEQDIERVLADYEKQELRDERLDNARGLLNDVNNTIKSRDKGITENPTPSAKQTETGHDSTPQAQTVQEKVLSEKEKTELEKEVKDLIDKISTLVSTDDSIAVKDASLRLLDAARRMVKQGAELKDCIETLQKFPQYQTLQSYQEVRRLIGDYIKSLYKPSEIKPQTSGLELSDLADDIDISATKADVRNQNLATRSTNVNGTSDKNYWIPSTSQYPIYRKDGVRVPFYEVAKTLKNEDGTPRYTDKQLKRMEVVYKFLENKGVFTLRNSQKLAVKETIQFAVYPVLNEEADDFVIVMLDSKGNVVGDLVDVTHDSANNYPNIKEVTEAIKSEYTEWVAGGNTGERFISTKYKSQINQLMVGHVEYSDELHSLNEIFTVQSSDGTTKQLSFKIGVVVTDAGGRYEMTTTSESGGKKGIDPIGDSAILPLKAKKGQPFLLIPTNNPKRAFMSVPFNMPKYNRGTSKSGLGKLIDDILEDIKSVQSSQDCANIKKKLSELLGNAWRGDDGKLKTSWHIDRKSIIVNTATDAELRSGITLKEQKTVISISYVPSKGSKALFTVTVDPADPNSIEALKQELYKHEIPFRLSRKYLNGKIGNQDYNTLIGELANTNVEPGFVTTTNNWFTINPVNIDGDVQKAERITSTKVNPTANTNQQSNSKRAIEWNGNTLYVDNSWNVTDGTGKSYTRGTNTLRFLGYAWGVVKSLDMTKPYNTEWGMYDPVKKDYIPKEDSKKLEKISKILESPDENYNTFTKEELTNELKLKGVFNTPKKLKVAEVLTLEQLNSLNNLTPVLAIQVANKLELQFNGRTNSFKVNPDTIISSVKNREVVSSDRLINIDKEVKWLNKVLPQFADKVSLVEGLIKIANDRNSDRAYGQFFNGIIVLSNIAAEGTVYHEAFHAVTNTLLSEVERQAMFEEAKNLYGNKDEIALEEELAEDFRRYIQVEEMFGGKIVKFFRKIKRGIASLLGKESIINKLYYNISRGYYAEMAIKDSMIVKNREVDLNNFTLEELQSIESEFNKLKSTKFSNYTELNNILAGNKLLNKARTLGIYQTDDKINKDAIYLSLDENRLTSLINNKIAGNNVSILPQILTDDRIKTFESQLFDSALEYQDRDDFDAIEDYHENKYLYENMSDSDRYYIKSVGFNEDLWNKLNSDVKKAIMHCR